MGEKIGFSPTNECLPFPPVNIALPESANSFFLYHASSGRTKLIADFPTLLRRKIVEGDFIQQLSGQIAQNVDGGTNTPDVDYEVKPQDLSTFYRDCLILYKGVSECQVPLYQSVVEKLKRLLPLEQVKKTGADDQQSNSGDIILTPPEIYYGRDARGLYLARKAEQFGRASHDQRKLIYVVTTRTLKDEPEFFPYLYQEGVTFDAYHIDTAWSGTGGRFILHQLANDRQLEFTEEDINRRIKLILSDTSSIESLEKPYSSHNNFIFNRDVINVIETETELFFGYPHGFQMDNGRIKPRIVYRPYHGDPIKEWVITQAVTRAFLPKVRNS